MNKKQKENLVGVIGIMCIVLIELFAIAHYIGLV